MYAIILKVNNEWWYVARGTLTDEAPDALRFGSKALARSQAANFQRTYAATARRVVRL